VLLKRCQADNVTAFAERLKPIVRAALADTPDAALLALLRNGPLREVIKQRMAADTCIRSNPKMLNEHELDTFLNTVAETVERI